MRYRQTVNNDGRGRKLLDTHGAAKHKVLLFALKAWCVVLLLTLCLLLFSLYYYIYINYIILIKGIIIIYIMYIQCLQSKVAIFITRNANPVYRHPTPWSGGSRV